MGSDLSSMPVSLAASAAVRVSNSIMDVREPLNKSGSSAIRLLLRLSLLGFPKALRDSRGLIQRFLSRFGLILSHQHSAWGQAPESTALTTARADVCGALAVATSPPPGCATIGQPTAFPTTDRCLRRWSRMSPTAWPPQHCSATPAVPLALSMLPTATPSPCWNPASDYPLRT